MWFVSSQQEHILSFPRGAGGVLYCMFVPWGHLTWTFRPMVCKLISVWINIWMSPLCFPLHLKPRQVASVLFLGSFRYIQRWRAYQRASSEREKAGDSWPPVAAAASPTPHGCIYRAPWMSHLAPCPLFLHQIYGSPHRGGLLDLRRAPLFPLHRHHQPPPRPTSCTDFRDAQEHHLASNETASPSRGGSLMLFTVTHSLSAMRRETRTWPQAEVSPISMWYRPTFNSFRTKKTLGS